MDDWPPFDQNLQGIGLICVGIPTRVIPEDRSSVLWPSVHSTNLCPALTWTFGNYTSWIMTELLPSGQNLKGNELICTGTSLPVVPEDVSAVSWPYAHSTKLSLTFHLDISLISYLSLTPTVLESHQIMRKRNDITNLSQIFSDSLSEAFSWWNLPFFLW